MGVQATLVVLGAKGLICTSSHTYLDSLRDFGFILVPNSHLFYLIKSFNIERSTWSVKFDLPFAL